VLIADIDRAVRVVTVADKSTTTHASTENLNGYESLFLFCRCVDKRKCKLTDSGLGDDPGETQEEHHTPNVEQTSHQNALDPAELDGAALGFFLANVLVCSLGYKF